MITDEPLNNPQQQMEIESNESVEKISEPTDQSDNQSENINLVLQDEDKLSQLSHEELKNTCLQMNKYIKYLQNLNDQNQTLINQKEIQVIQSNYEDKLKQQQLESIGRENFLLMRLTLKDQELKDCLAQIEALKNSKCSDYQLESYLLDPALNYIFESMKREVDRSKSRVEEMQNEMNAWKFSVDSITGKQLMSKCRQLHQENEELGKMISSGKIAKLESGLAMHKNYSETLNKSQADIEEVLNEIEENAEGFQNTVYYLQQQLKEYKEKNQKLKEILKECKCGCNELITTEEDVCDSP